MRDLTARAGRTYRLLTSTADLMALKEPWEELWRRAGAEYFLSFAATCHSWTHIHEPQGARLCCAVAFEDCELVAALPLIVHRPRYWRTASTCGPRSAECPDMLIAADGASPQTAVELMQSFLTLARPDYLELEFVRCSSHLGRALAALEGVRVVSTWETEVPYAELKGATDWASYYNSLGRRYQADTARCRRRLEEHGAVSFEVVRGEPTALIDWMLDHKQRWCARTGKHGDWVFSPQYRDYLNTLFASDQRYLVFALQLDGRPIAVKLMAINTDSASLLIIAYDESFRRFSPGNVLDEQMMQYVFENYRAPSGRHLDIHLGPGAESFKLHWARNNVGRARSYRIVTSWWGLSRLRLKSAVHILRRSGRH